jgi:hypothetical protein
MRTFNTAIPKILFTVCVTVPLALPAIGLAKGQPPGSDPAWISITFDGAIDGGPMECEEKLNADTTILGCNKGGGFYLDSVITDAVGADPECFEAGYTDGTIQLLLNKDGSAEAVFRFWARDRGDANEVLYVLRAHAPEWNGPFPPEFGLDPTTMHSTDWTLGAANRRQEKNACLGAGDDAIDVGVARLTP